MAATYGRLTGKAGVCMSTLGPGATNMVTPAAYAQLGAMPLVIISGQKPIKKSKLFQASSIVYYTSVNKQYIFNRFVQGKIVEAPENSKADLLTSWSFYDVSHNRPFICFMYFNYDGNKILDYRDEIYNVLKTVADRDMRLDMMAHNIDKRLPKVLPSKISLREDPRKDPKR